MPSGTIAPERDRTGPVASAPPGAREQFIEERLRQTRRQVKWVDTAAGLIALAAAALAYLLGVALIDHWLVAGGLGFAGRLVLWLALLAAGGAFFVHRVLPPLVRRVNPVFAAYTLERSRPTLKNSLINFLLLRGHRREILPVVYGALEERAASDLNQVEIEAAVDRRHVFRLGYVLVAVLAVFAAYVVVSPKSPLRSAARVLWPWADIPAPTRVTINDVRPGDAVAFYGEFVTVTAEVRGLRDGEEVLLSYSTADGQSVDQAVPMTVPDGDYRHRAILPPQRAGLQQDYVYRLAAGDSRAGPFRIEAQVAPAIVVESVEYDYPAYTGLARAVTPRQGDLRAVEGTRVTIRATANRPIRRAEIDLGCDGRRLLPMTIDGEKATGSFQLRLARRDPPQAEHDSYQLLLTDESGRSNRRPIRHRIEVIPDLAPVVEILHPQQPEVILAEDERLDIALRAIDPDYALRRVVLRAEREDGGALPRAVLVDRPAPGEPWRGEFEGAYRFEPIPLGLKAGDRVAYWAEALDNKEPEPNLAATERRWIRIVGPAETADRLAPEHVEPPRPTPAERPDAVEQPPGEPPAPIPPDAAPPDEQDPAAGPPDERSDPSPDEPEPAAQPPEGATPQDAEQEGGQEGQEGSPQGQEASPAAQEGSPAGQEGSPAGQEGSPAGEDGSPAGQDGSQAGQEGSSAGQDGSQTGQEGSSAGQDGSQTGQESSPAGQPRDGSSPGQPDGPINPDVNPGDAIERILEHRQRRSQPKAGDEDGLAAAPTRPEERDEGPESQEDQRPGGEMQPDQTPGAGQRSEDASGSPAPQEASRERPKQPGEPGDDAPSQESDPAQSPSISPHQSDSQSDTPGDRSGAGEQGGGQQAEQEGLGSPGSQTDAETGGAASPQPGDGQPGPGGGDRVESDRPTGGDQAARPGDQTGQPTQPGGAPSGAPERPSDDSSPPGAPIQDPTDGGQPGQRTSEGPGARGEGQPASGGVPRDGDLAPGEATGEEPGGDDPNLDYARRQTDLALEHLEDQLRQQEPDLLDRLGWDRDQARRFLQEWQEMKRRAAREDHAGRDARRQLDDALRSLGLRPQTSELRGGRSGTDRLDGLRDAGRFEPPADWAEWLRAYTKGVAGAP
jgi:hypothetical protein